MTPRSSRRARAREIYREMADKLAPPVGHAAETADTSSPRESAAAPTPDPSPRSASARGGGEKKEPNLTEKVRALYENSAVPVREIAGVAGVTERTIYKYVAKGGWKKRYRVAPDFAPVKGAGGRFIRRDDKDKPFARGLKATDLEGRARAVAACGKASRLSRAAQQMAEIAAARAELMRTAEKQVATIRHMVRYLSEITKIEATQRERAAALSLKEQDKAAAAKHDLESRAELALRIRAMLEQRRAAAGE